MAGSRTPLPNPDPEALDERDGVSLGVGGDERDRVASGGRRRAAVPPEPPHLVDEPGQVAVLEQGRRMHGHPVRVGEVAADVAHRGLEDARDRACVRSERFGGELHPLERGQDLQHGVAGRVRRGDGDVQVAEGATEGREHERLVRREVLDAHRGSGGAEARDVGRADRTPVEGLRAAGGQGVQGPGEGRLDERRTFREGFAVREEDGRHPRVGTEGRGRPGIGELGGVRAGERRAAVGEVDRALERAGPREPSAQPVQGLPAGDRAGDGDRVGAVRRHRPAVRRTQRSDIGLARRATRRVDREGLTAVVRSTFDQREEVTAHAALPRVDDRQGDGRGQRRVDRVPTGLERGCPRVGGGGVGGGDRPPGAAGAERPRRSAHAREPWQSGHHQTVLACSPSRREAIRVPHRRQDRPARS